MTIENWISILYFVTCFVTLVWEWDKVLDEWDNGYGHPGRAFIIAFLGPFYLVVYLIRYIKRRIQS